MAWSTPRTWVTSELVTAALMNTELRDNLNAVWAGKDFFEISAGAFRPATSNGGGGLAAIEHTAQRAETLARPLDKTADQHLIYGLSMPIRYGLGTFTAQYMWSCASAVATGIALACQITFVGDGEQYDLAPGTAVVVTDDAQSATYDHLITAESGAITPSGTPADGGLMFFDVFRDVSDANDDLDEDLLFVGAKFFYSADQRWEA